MGTPQAKRPKPSLDMSMLAPVDRQALERVASMLQKPVAELWAGALHSSQGTHDITSTRDNGSELWTTPTTQWEAASTLQNCASHYENRGHIPFSPPAPWSRFPVPGRVEGPCDNPSFSPRADVFTQTSHVQSEDQECTEIFGNYDNLDCGYNGRWSQDARGNADPWPELPTISLGKSDLQDEANDSGGVGRPLNITEYNPNLINDAAEAQDSLKSMHTPPARPSPNANDRVFISSDDATLFDSDDDEQTFEISTWEDVQPPQTSRNTDRLSSASNNSSDWSMIEMPREQDSFKSISSVITSKHHFEWIPSDQGAKDPITRQPRRRGPFLDKQLQEGTSETRKRKACVRCRMQKTRVSAEIAQCTAQTLTTAVSNEPQRSGWCLLDLPGCFEAEDTHIALPAVQDHRVYAIQDGQGTWHGIYSSVARDEIERYLRVGSAGSENHQYQVRYVSCSTRPVCSKIRSSTSRLVAQGVDGWKGEKI